AEQLPAEHEAGAGAARAARVHDRDRVVGRGDAGEILDELARRAQIAPAAERVRAALRNDVRLTARTLDALGLLGHQAIAIAPCGPRDPADLGADEAIEKDVAGRRGRLLGRLGAQHE